MTNIFPRKYILAAPPDVYGGIGSVLCRAFKISDVSLAKFEALLEKLGKN